MPHARLHGPDVGTRRDQQRRQIVPQIMEAETFGQRQDLVILGDVDRGLAYGTRSMSQGPTPLPRSMVTKNSPEPPLRRRRQQ